MTDLQHRVGNALADRYEIEREVGRGGMAVVFLARDRKLDRLVAVKVFEPDLAESIGGERFLREIEIAAKLTHPNILSVHDCGDADGLLYYVMPLVQGESLRERLAREGQLPIDQALRIACQVADALGHAHSQGVVHRDIKPGNIMLSEGHAVVSDFGIARAVTEAGTDSLTQTGIAVGTPAYMSPEQATGSDEVDARSDIYSLGAVLFEMLGGEPPYTGASSQAILAKKLSEPVPRVSVLRSTVSPSLEAAIETALARSPADRHQTSREFAEALQESDVRADPGPAGPSVRVRPAILAAALVVLLAVAAGLWKDAGRGSSGAPANRSITVLPVNPSSDDSLSVALAEVVSLAINSALGQIEGIVVKGHISATRFLPEQMSDARIMEELGVEALLRTELVQYGDRVQVYSSLYDASASLLWSDDYDYGIEDILNLPRTVARDIARGIEVDLTAGDEARLAARGTVDPEAYKEYALGHFLWTRRGDGLRLGKNHFERAIERDSSFADAWAGLADAYNMLGFYHLLPPTLGFPRGREAAQRALILDPGNARAHTALAAFNGWYDLDPEAAVEAFEAAMESDPEYWIAYAWVCPILDILGRSEEAVAACEQAIEGDPRYPIVHLAYGWRDWAVGDSESAVRRFRRILDLTPGSTLAHRLLGQALTELGETEEAETHLQLALADTAHSSRVEAQLAYLLAMTGRRDSARAIASRLERQLQEQAGKTTIQPYVSALDIAVAYAGLGEPDSTLAWLSNAYEERAGELFLVPLDPRFEFVRSDARFRELLSRHWRSGRFD